MERWDIGRDEQQAVSLLGVVPRSGFNLCFVGHYSFGEASLPWNCPFFTGQDKVTKTLEHW